MPAPLPGSENGKVMLTRVSLRLSRYQWVKKANKATALNLHCLILAFYNAFNLDTPRLKDHENLQHEKGRVRPVVCPFRFCYLGCSVPSTTMAAKPLAEAVEVVVAFRMAAMALRSLLWPQ